MIFNARILIQQLTRSAYEMGGIKRKKKTKITSRNIIRALNKKKSKQKNVFS